jgi:hypothetical protein
MEAIDMIFGLSALLGLALFVATLPVPGGVLFAPLPIGLFLFGLSGLLADGSDRTVRPRGGVVEDRSGWRHGS